MEDRLEKLKTVSFQEGLGNMYDKSERLAKLAEMVKFAINVKVDDTNLNVQLCCLKQILLPGWWLNLQSCRELWGVNMPN